MPTGYLWLNRYKSKLLITFPLTCSSFSLTFLAGNDNCILFILQTLGLPLTPLSPAGHMQFFSIYLLLGSYSELNPYLPCHCSVSLSCHHCIPEEFWDHFLPYSCAFTDWFTQNNQSLFKMCQNTPSCSKMLLTIVFLTRLNLKCYLLSAPWNLSVHLLALLFSQLLIPLHPSILSCSQSLFSFP